MNRFAGTVLIGLVLTVCVVHAGVITARPTERPWGDSFVPRSPRPADIIRVVPSQGLNADTELYRGQLIALNVAACEDMIFTTPKLAQELGIEVKIDLRNRFRTYADGMRWVWETYKEKLNPFLCDSRDPELLPYATFDMAFQWRGMMFWLTGPEESNLPGVDPKAELQLS